MQYGEEYEELGAIVTDNLDPEIESKLKISGMVDTSKIGTYTVTYNATDHAGNAAEQKTRTVTVLAPPPSPTPTATPSPTPSPSPTAEPTATPTASPTVKPTATPTATPTVKPTASPSPTPTTELTPTPTVTLSDRVEFERQADGTILAKIIFEKTAPPKSEDLVLYIAYYRDNRLIKLEIPTMTEMTEMTAMFKIDEALQDCEIRAFVWDKNMIPLMEVQKMNK